VNQLKQLLERLSARQRISIVTALIVTGALIYGVLHWRTEQDFKPLFTGLAPEDAAAVVQKLKESGVDYRLSENGTVVLTPAASVSETRLVLAGAGLPKTGRIGFELFDKTNFGITDFTEHVNFRRALEGELARSVLSLAEVQDARVHITFPKDSVFVESRQEGKASIIVRLQPGRQLTASNVTAIAHLVSSAVEGLAPGAVAILDSRGTLLSRPQRSNAVGDASGPLLDYKQELERDLSAKINQTLEAVLGAGKYRVGVNVECDYSTTEESEEVIDPSKSAIVTAQKTEETPSGTAPGAGIPGTASNLPRAAAPAIMRTSTPVRRTENVTYQSSRTVRLVKVPRGTINRVSVAVLLDYQARWEGSGKDARRTLAPPSPERLKTIRDLVSGVAGISSERGDQLIVDTLAFDSTLNEQMPDQQALPAAPAQQPDKFSPGELGKMIQVPLAVGLVLVVLLVLMLRRKPRKGSQPAATVEPGVKQIAGGAAQAESAAAQVERGLTAKLHEQEATRLQLEEDTLNALKLPSVTTKRSEVLTKHLREQSNKDPKAAAHLLRTWMMEDEA
jgi:flagellar M-ring protein FliF